MILMVGIATALTVVLYLWSMKGMMRDLPFGPRLSKILAAIRLV
jgi:hypothetical protein